MKRFHKLVVPLLAAAAIAYGCTQTIEEVQFIKLEETAYSFLGQGNGPCTIAVEASGDWDIEISAAWVRLVEKTAGNIVIEVDDNEASEDREAHIDFMCGDAFETVRVYQLGDTYLPWTFRYPIEFWGIAISPNGRYVGGLLEELQEDGSYIYNVIVIDTSTDERKTVASVPESMYLLGMVEAITDQGVIFIYDDASLGCVAFDLDGNSFRPQSMAGLSEECTVYASSADGRIWTGDIVSYEEDEQYGRVRFYNPVVWIDGEPEVLPLPPLNYRDQPIFAGVIARGMSHDGSVIYGSTWENTDHGMVYWKKGAQGYEVDYVGQDVRKVEHVTFEKNGEIIETVDVCGMTIYNERMNCSPSGQYIAGTYRTEDRSSGTFATAAYPAFFNTETGKTTIFWDLQGTGTTVTDDGIGFTTDGDVLCTSGQVVDVENGVVLGSVQEWVRDVYGYEVPVSYIDYIGPDGSIRGGTLIDVISTLKNVNWYMVPKAR